MMSPDDFKKSLKNMTTANKIVASWLAPYLVDEYFMDDRIIQLLSYHPAHKAHELEYLVIRIEPTFKTRQLCFKNISDPDEDSISYKSCIQNLFGRFCPIKASDMNIKQAFRIAISPYRCEFLRAHSTDGVSNCEHCDIICGKGTETPLHVDHVNIPFKRILADFLTSEHIDYSSIIVKHIGCNTHLADDYLKERWVSYHDSIVKYRILCGPCNTSFGADSTSE